MIYNMKRTRLNILFIILVIVILLSLLGNFTYLENFGYGEPPFPPDLRNKSWMNEFIKELLGRQRRQQERKYDPRYGGRPPVYKNILW